MLQSLTFSYLYILNAFIQILVGCVALTLTQSVLLFLCVILNLSCYNFFFYIVLTFLMKIKTLK